MAHANGGRTSAWMAAEGVVAAHLDAGARVDRQGTFFAATRDCLVPHNRGFGFGMAKLGRTKEERESKGLKACYGVLRKGVLFWFNGKGEQATLVRAVDVRDADASETREDEGGGLAGLDLVHEEGFWAYRLFVEDEEERDEWIDALQRSRLSHWKRRCGDVEACVEELQKKLDKLQQIDPEEPQRLRELLEHSVEARMQQEDTVEKLKQQLETQKEIESEIRKEHEESEARAAAMEDRLAITSSQAEQTGQALRKSNEEKRALAAEASALREQVETLTSQKSDLNSKLFSLESTKQELEGICEKLTEDLQSSNDESKRSRESLEQLQNNFRVKVQALDEATAEMSTLKAEHLNLSKEHKALLVQLAHANARVEALETEWVAATKDNRQLQESEMFLKTEVRKLKATTMEQHTSVLRLREESQSWKAKLEKQTASENAKIKDLEYEVKHLEEQLGKKDTELAEFATQKEADQVQLAQAQDRLEASLAAKERAENRAETLRGRLEGEKEALQQNLAAAEEYSKEAKAKVNAAESQLESALDDASHYRGLNERMQEELTQVKEREQELLHQLNEQKSELASESHRLVLASERFEEVNFQFRHLQNALGTLRAKEELQSKNCDELSKQQVELESKLDLKCKQVTELEHLCNGLENEVVSLRDKCGSKDQELRELQKKLEEEAADCAEFKSILEDTQQKLSDAQHRLEEAGSELTLLRPLQEEVDRAQKNLASLEPLPQLLAEANSNLEHAEKEQARLRKEAKAAGERLDEMSSHYTRIKDQLSVEQSLRKEAQKRLEDEVGHMSASLLHISRSAISGEEASRELDLTRSEYARLKEELLKLENTVADLNSEKQGLRADLEAKSRQLDALRSTQKSLEEMELKCASYEKSLLSSARECERLEKALNSIQAKVDTLSKDATESHSKLSEARLKIQGLELERAEMQERLRRSTFGVRTSAHSAHDSASVEHKLQDTIESLQDDLSEKESDLSELQGRVDALQTELEEEKCLRRQAEEYAAKAAVKLGDSSQADGESTVKTQIVYKELSDVRMQNNELRERIREFQREAKSHARAEKHARKIIDEQAQKLATLTEQLQRFKIQCQEANSRAESDREKVQSMASELAILREKYEALHVRFDEKVEILEDKLSAEEDRRKELENHLKQRSNEVAAARLLKESFLDKEEEHERAIINLHKELDDAQAEKADAISRIEGLQHQLLQMQETTSGQLKEIESLKEEQERFRSKATKTRKDSERAAKNDLHLSQLARLYSRESALRRSLHNTLVELKGNIRVYVRVRPLMPAELKEQMNSSIPISFPELGITDVCQLMNFKMESSTIRGAQIREFDFDRVFTPLDGQKVVFEEIAPYVASVLDGYNTCIFCYGATGSGKTHTMIGPDGEPGIFPRAVQAIFKGMARGKKSKTVAWPAVEVYGSLIEVYNEQIRDLLVPKDEQAPLELKTSKDGSTVPCGLVKQRMHGVSDALTLLETGAKNRVTEATKLNVHSSRSHMILLLQVVVRQGGEKFKGKLYLVDLAGSERLKRSQSTGDRLEETKQINRSLSALGDVISALSGNSPHVPYRNSKLTHVLMDCLCPHAKCVMIANISPAVEDSTETVNTLNFATRVKSVELGRAITFQERVGEAADKKEKVMEKWKKAISSAKIQNLASESHE